MTPDRAPRPSQNRQPVLRYVAALLVASLACASFAATVFRVESSAGDPLGNGQTYERTPPATSFMSSCDAKSATVYMTTDSRSSQFKISSANDAPLVADVYEGATRRQTGEVVTPELSVSLDQVACTRAYGRFVLRSFTCSAGGQITELAVDALQHCQTPDAPPLKMFLRVDSNVPLVVPQPTAMAGPDVAATEGEFVNLDGSQSTAPAGIASVLWQQVSGPTVAIANGVTLRPGFYAPDVPPGGATVVLELVVTDTKGLVDRNRVNIFVRDVADPRTFVVMTGVPGRPARQAFTDLDTQISGNCTSQWLGVAITGQDSASLQFESATNATLTADIYEDVRPTYNHSDLAPGMSFTGTEGCNLPMGRAVIREFACGANNRITRLALDSEHFCSLPRRSPMKTVIRFNSTIPEEVPQPTAAAGSDQVTTEGDPVQLDGSRSYAPNGIASVAWQQISGPAVTLSNSTSLKPSFVAPSVAPGGATVVMQLQVTGSNGLVNSDRVNIAVRDQADPRNQLTVARLMGIDVGGGLTQMFSSRDSVISSNCSANSVYVSLDGNEFWTVSLAAADGAPLTATTYENAQRWPFQAAGSPGMDVSGGGAGCSQLTGRFVVHEFACNPNGSLARLSADMQQSCVGSPMPTTAFIRMNSAVPIPTVVDRGCRLDVDGNIALSPAYDSPILLRALAGWVGQALEPAQSGFNAQRSTYWQLETYFANTCGILPRHYGAGGCSLDLDGDGKIQLATDGVIATRLIAGLTGDTVLANATAAGATRTTWSQLAPHLAACKLLPAP